jgi:transposase
MARSRGKRNLMTGKKARIVGMVDAGMSHAKVGKAVGLGRTTITEIVKRSKARGTVKTAKKSGRPRLNTDRNLCQL